MTKPHIGPDGEIYALPLNTENSAPRLTCILVVDESGSMSDNVDELNAGFADFVQYMKNDAIAMGRVEVAIISAGGSTATVKFPLQESANLQPLRFDAGGVTPLGEALTKALDMVRERKADCKREGVEYYRPWIVVMSDGYPTDDCKSIVSDLRAESAKRGVNVFPISVGDHAGFDFLNNLCRERPSVRMQEAKFSQFFDWLSNSLSAVSQSSSSGPSDAAINSREETMGQVSLPAINGWGTA